MSNTQANRGVNYAKKQSRLEADEKELEALMARQSEAKTEVDEEEDKPQVTKVAEPADEPKAEKEESNEGLTGEEKSFKKRYGDLRRHMSSKEKEWEERFKTLENKPADFRAPKSDEDIAAWARQYPDIAAIVETIADKKANERFSAADARFRELDEAKGEAERTKAENTIRKSHSDFDELRDGDAFHDWVDEQPKWVQNALYENADDPDSVIRVLDLYKTDNGLTPSAKKAKVKDAAAAVKTGKSRADIDPNDTSGTFSESQVNKMGVKEFEENYPKIQAAMNSGKFVYDMTGNAR